MLYSFINLLFFYLFNYSIVLNTSEFGKPVAAFCNGTFWSSNQAATCLPHTVEASHCLFSCWTSSREAVNLNFKAE